MKCKICNLFKLNTNDDGVCEDCNQYVPFKTEFFGNLSNYYVKDDKQKKVKEEQLNSIVNPSHYKSFVGDYEWIEVMSMLPVFKEPKVFKGALEILLRGYLDRKGQKDDELTELKKARFYLQYMIKYIENGNKTVLAKDVHESLEN